MKKKPTTSTNNPSYIKPTRTFVFRGQIWPRQPVEMPIEMPFKDEELERRRKRWQKNW